MHASTDPQSPQRPARESPLLGGHLRPRGHRPPPFPQPPDAPAPGWGPVCRCLWGGRPGEERTGHLPSTAPPRGCRAALPAHRGGGRPALPCPPYAASTHRPPQLGFTSAGRRGRCRCRSPGPPSKAGGSQESCGGGPAPPRTCVSSSRLLPLPSLSSLAASAAPGAPPTQPLSPRPALSAARSLYRRAPPPSSRTRSLGPPRHRLLPGPLPRRRGSRAPEGVCSRPGCGGKSVARGRVLPAIAQIAGYQVGPVCRREPTGGRPSSPA
ncbi:basic salivary proline-rich protein 2-like [Lynx rufus]|uniref:basic salivary proline-rich protein 2-like n=1 Tax=Lynx rufus TaxID=61384 RepID=UPI001F128164|nr:basic salivary proline-rich protein 2-like [Lynx rufus]